MSELVAPEGEVISALADDTKDSAILTTAVSSILMMASYIAASAFWPKN